GTGLPRQQDTGFGRHVGCLGGDAEPGVELQEDVRSETRLGFHDHLELVALAFDRAHESPDPRHALQVLDGVFTHVERAVGPVVGERRSRSNLGAMARTQSHSGPCLGTAWVSTAPPVRTRSRVPAGAANVWPARIRFATPSRTLSRSSLPSRRTSNCVPTSRTRPI